MSWPYYDGYIKSGHYKDFMYHKVSYETKILLLCVHYKSTNK